MAGSPAEPGVVDESPFGPPGSVLGASGSVSGSHVYADNGLYTVTVTLIAAGVAYAYYGVATDTDRIVLEEPLIQGESYDLPEIAVINSGDVRGIYEVQIGYKTAQREIKPPAEWFTFNPQTMTLGPDEHQFVSISVTIPAEAETGDYFAYVESFLAYGLVDGQSVWVGMSVGTALPFRVISPTPTPLYTFPLYLN